MDSDFGATAFAAALVGSDWKGRRRRQGDEIRGNCPLPDHPDKHPSFGYDVKKNAWACSCGNGLGSDLMARLGFTPPNGGQHPLPPTEINSQPEAIHVYANGNRKLRFRKSDGGKWCKWQHRENGAWIDGMSGQPGVYRQDSVTDAEDILFSESESDVDALVKLGFTAVATGFGAESPLKDTDAQMFHSKVVYICEHQDEPGRKYAAKCAGAIRDAGGKACILKPPQGCKDIRDHIKAGGTTESIKELMKTARTGGKPWPPPHTDLELVEASGRPVRWLIEPLVAHGHVVLVYGVAKGMKSSLMAALAQGGEAGNWPPGCFIIEKPIRVAILNFEDGVARIARRLVIAAGQMPSARMPATWSAENAPKITLPDDEERTLAWIKDKGIELLIIDTIAYTYGSEIQDENNAAQIQRWAASIRRIATQTDAGIMLVTHARKGGRADGPMQNAARGSSVLSGLADSLLLLERREDGTVALECVCKDAPPGRWIATYDPKSDAPWSIREDATGDGLTASIYAALVELAGQNAIKIWSVAEVSDAAGVSENTARKELRALVRQGQAEGLPRKGKGGGMGYQLKKSSTQ